MAEALPPEISGQEMPSTVRVRVLSVDDQGKIKLEPASHALLSEPLPEYVNLPIPNVKAYNLVRSKLTGNTFDWFMKKGEAVKYNIFLDDDGNNVTYDLYMEIVYMLEDPSGLPELDMIGTCRVSPIFDTSRLYVQPEPAYVDTISYVIYLRVEDMKLKGLIDPAANVVMGETYVLADGDRNYRVRLQERTPSPEPLSYKELGESRVSQKREKTMSTICGNPPHRANDEKVWVFRIDYGGPLIPVNRSDLYAVETVCSKIKLLPDLIFPISVRLINGINLDTDARFEILRDRQEIIEIETVANAGGGSPAKIDIYSEKISDDDLYVSYKSQLGKNENLNFQVIKRKPYCKD